mgnify:CR=1 FL=1
MFDMFNIMNKVKEAQAKVKAAQDNLVHVTATGESGGGMVKATVNGQRQLIKLDIDPDIFNDKEMLQDLIVAAVNKSMQEIDGVIKAELKKSMEGVVPNIPGFDLENLFNR